MNTNRITKELFTKVFDESYADTMKAAYDADVADGMFDVEEKDYADAAVYLDEHLNAEQKELLQTIERLYKDRWSYASKYPFICGMVHAFEQFFDINEYSFCYEKAISEGMCTNPGMQRHGEFCTKAEEVLCAFKSLEEGADDEMVEHFTSIACAWDQRIHSATVHSFYLGYQTGLKTLDVVKPLASMRMVEKTLYLEYQLGLTEPYSMRESAKERHAD